MRFSDAVIDSTPLSIAGEESTPLHESQMLRSDVVRNLTVLGQLTDREPTVQQELNHT